MNSIQVHLFGKFRAEVLPDSIFEFESGKAEGLFCYLMLNQVRAHHREALMCLLWNNTDTNHSRRYLRKTLWQLQSAIDPKLVEKGGTVFLIEPEWMQVNPNADIWIDAYVFEETYNQVRGLRGRQLDSSQVRALEMAVDLYQGDLLEGWYQEWCIYERERLQQIFLLILDKLVEFAEFHDQHEQGIYYANRILLCDYARERTYRSLMRLYAAAGDRTTALRRYEKCLTILADELGIPPAARTTRLYEQIKNGAGTNSRSRAAGNQVSPPIRDLLSDMLENLQSMQIAINSIQHLIQQIGEQSEPLDR